MKEEKLILSVVNLEEDMREIKERLSRTEQTVNQIFAGQDKMMQILLRIDQERLATNARMERFETIQNEHTKDIQQLKAATGTA